MTTRGTNAPMQGDDGRVGLLLIMAVGREFCPAIRTLPLHQMLCPMLFSTGTIQHVVCQGDLA
jgi:hypothetical protein